MNVTTKIEHEWQADAVREAARAKGWKVSGREGTALATYPYPVLTKWGALEYWTGRDDKEVVSFGAFLDAIPEYKPELMIGGHEVKVLMNGFASKYLEIGCTTVTKEQWEAAGKLAGWV